jgi:hypothetical protein
MIAAEHDPSADVLASPPYRGMVRLLARTIAGTEALESLADRPDAGVMYVSRSGTKAGISAVTADALLDDLIHDHGVTIAPGWLAQAEYTQ